MKLYRLTQDANQEYETYDSVVVAANNADDAVNIHPSGHEASWIYEHKGWGIWTTPENVKAEYIGEAAPHIKAGVVLASFNAG